MAGAAALTALLLLAALCNSALAVNDQKVDQILGTGTRQSNPDTNYESTLSSEAKIETRGTGTAPNHVGYFGFDFGSHAPTPSRFCAYGTPRLYINYSGDCSSPGAFDGIVLDVPGSSINYGTVTWNTQPPLTSYLARVTPSTYTDLSDSKWYYVDFHADMLNKGVHQNSRAVTLRTYYNTNIRVCWETHGSNSFWWSQGTYKAYITFDYSTCDPNATCLNAVCSCNLYYSGTGTSCTYSACEAASMGNANFPKSGTGSTVTGTCQTTFQGTPTASCNNKMWGAVSNPCTKITCAAVSDGVGNANFPTTNAGTSATGTCLSGYSGSATRPCSNTGEWGAATASCTRISCAATTIGAAHFPVTNSLTTATGTCAAGYQGSPTSYCTAAGTWEGVTNPCTQRGCAATVSKLCFS